MTWARSARVLLLALALFVGACTSRQQRVAEFAARADHHLADGDPPAALIELRNALKLAPVDPAINLRVAQVYDRMGNAADALFFYSEAARLDPSNDEALLEQAKLLLFTDPKRARELIDSVLARNPASARAHVRASELALVQSDTFTGLREAETAVQLAPNDPYSSLQLGVVRRAQIREHELHHEPPDDALFKAALAAFDQMLSQAKDGDSLLVERAWLERSATLASWPGHTVEASKSYRDASTALLELPTQATDKLFVLGRTTSFAQGTGDRDLERWALDRTLELKPDSYAAWNQLADLDDKEGKAGTETLARLIAQRPDDAEAHALYARRLASEERVPDAIAHLEEASKHLKDPSPALRALAEIQLRVGNLPAARDLVARLQREYSGNLQTDIISAELAAADGRLDEAATTLRSVTGQDEQNVPALLLLADVDMRRHRATDATAAMRKAIGVHGEPAPLAWLRELGRMELATGDWNAAANTYRTIFRRAGVLQPVDLARLARALYELGLTEPARRQLEIALEQPEPTLAAIVVFNRFEAKRDPERARALLESAITRFPRSEWPLAQLVRLELSQGHPDVALARIDKELAAKPGSPSLRLVRANALVAIGRTSDALADAQRAVDLDPDQPGAIDLLARLLRSDGRTDDAIRVLDAREASGHLGPGETTLLARLLLERGDDARATALLEKVLAQRDAPGAKNDLAYLLAKDSGDLRRALDLAREARAAKPDVPEFADTLGTILLRLGQPEAAIDQLHEAVDLADEGSAVRASAEYHLGLAFKAAGREADAKSAFERALAAAVKFPEADDTRRELDALATQASAAKPSS